jgi:2'-5' RNA ligase
VRLFVGVELDAAIVDVAAAVIDDLRRAVAERAPRARISWLTRDRLHLTLAFIGNVDDGRLQAIHTQLRPPYSTGRFDVGLGGLGVFPERGHPRVVWVGIETGRDLLHALAEEVTTRLAGAGIEREERDYNPHLTLARVREPGDLRADVLLSGRDGIVLGTSVVRAITLLESRLSPKGPSYRAIERMALAAS